MSLGKRLSAEFLGNAAGFRDVLDTLENLHLKGTPPADLHPEVSREMPRDLAGLVAQYELGPLVVRLRSRLALEYLRKLAQRMGGPAAAPAAP